MAYKSIRQKVVEELSSASGIAAEQISSLLEVPPAEALGDYSLPCFKISKEAVKKAEELRKKLQASMLFERIETKGPYVNLFLEKKTVAKEVLLQIAKEKATYGRGKGKKEVVVEYCGPNTNKPLHLGHLRNMALGNALCRLLAFQGNTVHPVNIINDRGIHICKSMLAYHKWGHQKKPNKKGDHFVGDFYVLFDKAAKEEEEKAGKDHLKKEAQEMLLKWELGDKETRALWKKMNSWVLKGFAETYKRFGISFEKDYFESDYYQRGKEVVQEGLEKGIFQKDPATGAIIAPLEKFGLPDKVLLRGDDTSIYMTQDMYLAALRYKDFKFQQMIYVTASEQRLHFQQLFAILELLGKEYVKNMFHFSYGLVNLPSGRMKSREGTVVDADDVMDEIAALAEKEVRARYKELSSAEIKKRAEAIALAALRFFMLKTDAVRDMVFNPEESISFEGETGPYVQYTHARACSILRKAGRKLPNAAKAHLELLQEAQEWGIARLLALFPEKAEEAAMQYKPHILCHYLLDLAQAFNEFYHAYPVISEDKELMAARLQLVACVRQVLAQGMGLLGIEALEEM